MLSQQSIHDIRMRILPALRRMVFYLVLQFFVRGGLANGCSDTGTLQVLQLNVTCDRYLDVYIDGQHVSSNTHPSVSKVDIGIGSNVVAIKCKGLLKGSIGGILASLSNGVVTDKTWQCSTTFEHGWNMRNFEELGWSSAVEHKTNSHSADIVPYDRKLDIVENAKFIWTANSFADKEIYCRKALIERCNEQRFRFYTSRAEWKNKASAGSTLKKTSASSSIECGMNCLNTPKCVSFNYEIVDKNQRICELCENRSVSAMDLRSRTGFQYFEMIKAGY